MGSVSSPILVGREAELARLLHAIEVAQGGRPQLVVVSGEAGIGKSRLMAEVVARAREAGSRILTGGCLDIGDASVPFLPLAEALRGLARSTPPGELDGLLGPTREDLATIAPELARADRVEAAAAGTVGQARLFERTLELIGRLGDRRPVVVVVEDVQWIDRATRDLITFLARNVTTERVAAFLTVRTEDLPRGHPYLAWLAELGRVPGGVRLALEPLDRAEVAQQIAAIAGDVADIELVERIWRRSEGNPFFAEELYAAAVAGTNAAGSLVEILLGRLRALEPDTREVLRVVALAGRAVDERLPAEVLGLPLETIRPALREAVERHVLREEPSGAVLVRHELLREAIEGELLAVERRDLHERLASVLTADPALADPGPAGAAGELARHWAAAGRVPEAYAAAVAAGRAAEAVHAYADAFREYERAIALEGRLPADARPAAAARLELRSRAAESADLAGAFERAIALAHEGLELAAELGEVVTRGLLHGRLGYLRWAAGDAAGGLEEHREAVRLVPADPPTAARARVLGGLAGSLMAPGGYEESGEIARAAIDCAQAAGAVAEEARARNVLGFDLVALGRLDAGLDELARSRDLAREAGPPDMLVVAHYNLALNLAEAGRLEEAIREATAGRDAARRAGLERRFGFDLAALAGDVLLRLGRWDEADAVTREALALDRAGRGSAYLSAVRGRLEALRGALEAAGRRFDDADALGAGDDPDLADYVACGRAEAALAAGSADTALAAVEKTVSTEMASHALFVRASLQVLGLRAAADLAERARAERDAGSEADARRRAAPIRDEIDVVGSATRVPATALLVEVARAESDRLEPPGPPAERWSSLADRLAEVGDRHLASYAGWRAVEAELRVHGTRGDVQPRLRAAYEAAAALGARPLRDEIVGLARRARVALEPAEAQPAAVDAPIAAPATDADDGVAALRRAGLSDREIEVLRLVVAGRTNGQIAERLFITRKTAGVHVTHILDKLAVGNRVEAAMVAARLGLGDGEARD